MNHKLLNNYLQNRQNPLEEKLNKNNIKPTAMRILVLQYLMEQNTAVSLKSLEASFHKAATNTLYRTLKNFEEKNLLH